MKKEIKKVKIRKNKENQIKKEGKQKRTEMKKKEEEIWKVQIRRKKEETQKIILVKKKKKRVEKSMMLQTPLKVWRQIKLGMLPQIKHTLSALWCNSKMTSQENMTEKGTRQSNVWENRRQEKAVPKT